MRQTITILLLTISFFCFIIITGCNAETEKSVSTIESGIIISRYVADDFRNKTSAAENWVEENLLIKNTDLCRRNASDIIAIEDTTYVSFASVESNGLAELHSYQLVKISEGKMSTLVDESFNGPYGDFPINVVKDGENTLLSVFGDSLIGISTWGDSARIIVTYDNGVTESIDYSFTDDLITENMLGGHEYRGFRCEFIHQLAYNEVSSIVFISYSPLDNLVGITTRLFELNEDSKIISARVVTKNGTYDDGPSTYCYGKLHHMYPELFE